MKSTDPVLLAALSQGLPHAAFRLYVILDGAARQANAKDEYFPVTLEGLMQLHPGVAGRTAGSTTIIKQIAALRALGLLETRAAIHRTEPRKPVLVRVTALAPQKIAVASVANSQ